MSALRYRRRLRLGPLRVNISGARVTSVAVVLGPFTYNLTRRRATADLPGGWSWHQGGTR